MSADYFQQSIGNSDPINERSTKSSNERKNRLS